MRISDWSSDVCSSDLACLPVRRADDQPDAVHDLGARALPRRPVHRAGLSTDPRPAGAARSDLRLPRAQARRARTAGGRADRRRHPAGDRTEDRKEHTSELQSLMRISYAVFCLKKKIRKAEYKIHK